MTRPAVRPPAVADSPTSRGFYPGDPATLRRTVEDMLAGARTDAPTPPALIAPHAGYVYSGPIAASVYARLRSRAAPIERVVLFGPAHRVGFRGLATHTAAAFATPLGAVPIDRAAVARVERLPFVGARDWAHEREHSLEVHLPFLQVALGKFSLVPVLVGYSAEPEQVAAALRELWGGPETLVVISSDLTHFLDHATASLIDAETSRRIAALEGEGIGPEQACGHLAVRGLLLVARELGLRGEIVDLRNSGDTAGPRDRVVGYGAYAFA